MTSETALSAMPALPVKTVTLSQMTPGDLVFWRMSEEASHVEMFAGKDAFDSTSIHAVNNPDKGMQRLMATSFLPQFFKHVYRCRRPELVRRAFKYAKNWSAYENKYDKPRIQTKEVHRDTAKALGIVGDARRRQMLDLFMQRGRFRAIKFTTRRATILCYPGEQDGSGRGLTCCMFAILCYQVAGLADHVYKVGSAEAGLPDNSPLVRVSDKKVIPEEFIQLAEVLKLRGFSAFDIASYAGYLNALQEVFPYGLDFSKFPTKAPPVRPRGQKIPGASYYPSILFWKKPPISGFDFGAAMTPAMLLDAKIATPEDFRQSIEADIRTTGEWEYLGALNAEVSAAPTEQAKQLYQTAVGQRKDQATQLRDPFIRH